MTTDREIRELIDKARARGAIIRITVDPPYDSQGNGTVSKLQVRTGVPGCGDGWMPVISAAEKLRAFVYSEGAPNA